MIVDTAATVWWHVEEPALRLMNLVSRSIANFESKYRGGLPDMRTAARMIIASDYGGDHKDAPYEAMCLLVASAPSVGDWQHRRQQVRSSYLPDGRRLSYKGLNDEKKRKALFPFLSAANGLHGAIVAVLIDKRLQSLFQSQDRLSDDDPELVDLGSGNRALSNECCAPYTSLVFSCVV